MAKTTRKTNTRKTKTSRQKKAATRKRASKRRLTAVKAINDHLDSNSILDLTGAPDRPTVKLPGGDFEMRLSEELTFDEFSQQTSIGKKIIELADDADDPEVLEKLQALIVKGSHMLLVDLTDEAAAGITPGMFQKVTTFFNRLALQIDPGAS